jgi:hypothetical protein
MKSGGFLHKNERKSVLLPFSNHFTSNGMHWSLIGILPVKHHRNQYLNWNPAAIFPAIKIPNGIKSLCNGFWLNPD